MSGKSTRNQSSFVQYFLVSGVLGQAVSFSCCSKCDSKNCHIHCIHMGMWEAKHLRGQVLCLILLMGLKATVLALLFHAYISACRLQIPDSFLDTIVPLWLFCETMLSNIYIGFIYYNNSMPSNMIHLIIVGGKTLCVL